MIKRSREVADFPGFFQDIYEYGEGSPKIMFTGGIHGDEVTGIYTAEKLIEYFNHNAPVKGSIKIMPRCNPVAMRQMTRRAFYDNADMNRIFPGAADGSPTYRAAENVWQESEGMDIMIDLHCREHYAVPYTLAIYDEFPEVKDICMKLSIPILVKSEGTGGQLFTESCRRRGQKALIIELPNGPSPGTINFDAASECYEALLNFLRFQEVIEGDYIDNPPQVYSRLKDVTAKDYGLWLPQVTKGQKIRKGDVIGTLNSIHITAEEEGTILMAVPGSYLYRDDRIITYIQEI